MATVAAKPTESSPPGELLEPPPRPKYSKMLKSSFKAYLFIAPAILILFIFHFFPIVYAFFLSLYKRISVVKGLVPPSENFAGFDNYANLMQDPEWWNALFNTLTFAAGVVVIGLSVSLGISLLLDKVVKGKEFYRIGFFLPYVTSLYAVGVVWYIIFSPYASNALVKPNPDRPGGLINWIFAWLGIPMQRWLIDDSGVFKIMFDNGQNVDWVSAAVRLVIIAGLIAGGMALGRRVASSAGVWLGGLLFGIATVLGWSVLVELMHVFKWEKNGFFGGPSLAMVAIIIIACWHSLGFNIVIILAGLTSISRELYEAARIDGARGWAMLTKMTIPLLSPTLFFLLVVTTLSAFQVFILFFAVLPGGFSSGVKVLSLFYYDVTFQRGSQADNAGFGYASTIVVCMMVLLIAISTLQQTVLSKKVNYD